MRLVIQRVKQGSVTVDGEIVSEIGPGLLILVGIAKDTDRELIPTMAHKSANMRIFEDDRGKFHYSALDLNAELLVVSQFTLCANLKKGRRPDFGDACAPKEADLLYKEYCRQLELLGLTVKRGIFAANMGVSLINDGPVTLVVDQKDL